MLSVAVDAWFGAELQGQSAWREELSAWSASGFSPPRQTRASARYSNAATSWVATSTATLSSRATRSRSAVKLFCANGSSCEVGSSSKSSFGRMTSAAARATSCCSPPESSLQRLCKSDSMPKKLTVSKIRRRISFSETPRFSRPKASSFKGVSHTSACEVACGTNAMVSTDCACVIVETSWPQTIMEPSLLP